MHALAKTASVRKNKPPNSALPFVSCLGHADHNSVTIKSDTSVKDAAGAICKVLNRLASTFVTALQLEGPTSHESTNRAVKALAVSRKYIQDGASGHELGNGVLLQTKELELHIQSQCQVQALSLQLGHPSAYHPPVNLM